MGDDDVPTTETDEPGEPWVTDTPGVAQRVPGIEEAQETTYVEPPPGSRRRAVLIGAAVGLAVVAVFAAIVFSSSPGGDSKEATTGPGAVSPRTSSTTWSTTTTTGATPASTAATTVTTAATVGTTTPTAAPAATPRATADPATPVYQPVQLPAGLHATLTSCSWQPTSGGRYEAGGTLTNGPSTNHGWTITIHWLQDGRQIAQQSGVVDLTAGGSKPWSLTLSAPTPPADIFSCALSAA